MVKMFVSGLAVSLCIFYADAALAQDATSNLSDDPVANTARNAQDSVARDAGNAGDIIVTAQKREQRLQDVGLAITVLGEEALDAMGVRDSTDVTAQVPNLQNASIFGPGTNVNLALRGVALADFNDLTEAPVAVYADEIYYVPLGAGSFPTFDLNRVEVLRGPQGTLFGRNTTGGILHYISNRPEQAEAQADVEVEYGSYDTLRFNGMANIPVGNGIAFRIAGTYHQNDGWIKNDQGQADAGALKTYGVRGQIGFDDGGPFTANAKFEYGHSEGPTTAYHRIDTTRDPVTGLVELPSPSATGSPWKVASNGSFHGLKGANSYTGTLHLNYDLGGGIDLTSITGYNHYDRLSIEDVDGTPELRAANSYDFQSEQYSQELRIAQHTSTTDWTAGVYYIHQSANSLNTAPLFVDAAGIAAVVLNAASQQTLASYAVYGNIEHSLSDKLSVVAGARYTHDKKDFSELLRYFSTDTSFFDVWPDSPHDFNETFRQATLDFTPGSVGDLTKLRKGSLALKAQVNYRPGSDTLLYASINRGVKAGGFNNGYIDLGTPIDKIQYKPETVYVYEAGIKTQLFDRRLTFNATSFYYDYSNYQALIFVNLGGFTQNKKARIYGAEFEIAARPFDGFTFSGGLGLLNTKVYGVTTPPPASLTFNSEMILAPKWSLNGLARYEFGVGAGTIGTQIDFKATARYHAEVLNNPAVDIPAYHVVNARVDFSSSDDRFSIAAFMKNAFNKKYRVQAYDLVSGFGFVYEQFAPPRWIGVSLGYRFN